MCTIEPAINGHPKCWPKVVVGQLHEGKVVRLTQLKKGCFSTAAILKQSLGMTSIPVSEVVYPTDHVFIFFRIFIFLQIFLINISMNPEVTQTNYLYT